MTSVVSQRNYMLAAHRRDGLIEWMKEILNHSFVLNAPHTYIDSFSFFEELIEEHKANPEQSRLKLFVPSVGIFHTSLSLQEAFLNYDKKYAITKRRNICPTFNELRHILNLAQVMCLGTDLELITFDGDQTLYTDGGNFEYNAALAKSICTLLRSNVKVAVVTAAGYGLDGVKYAIRLQGLLDSFIDENLSHEEVARFFVFGGECNYLLQAVLSDDSEVVNLLPVPEAVWQAESFTCPKPSQWPQEDVKQILDIAESTMQEAISDLRLRAKLLRKERAVGIYPGGDGMVQVMPIGHGSKKLKQEALDETVFRVREALRVAQPKIPYCVFNGGKDAWVDIGNKSVAVQVLQAFLGLCPSQCLHVGDQFLSSGNDYAARSTCPCIWITSPRETEKILEHVLKYKFGLRSSSEPGTPRILSPDPHFRIGSPDHVLSASFYIDSAAAEGGSSDGVGCSAVSPTIRAKIGTLPVPIPVDDQSSSSRPKVINVYTGMQEDA